MKGFHKAVKQFPTGAIRIAKESFSPSFAGLAAEEDTPDSSESKNSENEKSGKKKDSKRRKYIDVDAVTACRGCGFMGHYHLHYFYLLL